MGFCLRRAQSEMLFLCVCLAFDIRFWRQPNYSTQMRNTSCTLNFSATNEEKSWNLRLSLNGWKCFPILPNILRAIRTPLPVPLVLLSAQRTENELTATLRAVKTINSAGPFFFEGEKRLMLEAIKILEHLIVLAFFPLKHTLTITYSSRSSLLEPWKERKCEYQSCGRVRDEKPVKHLWAAPVVMNNWLIATILMAQHYATPRYCAVVVELFFDTIKGHH